MNTQFLRRCRRKVRNIAERTWEHAGIAGQDIRVLMRLRYWTSQPMKRMEPVA